MKIVVRTWLNVIGTPGYMPKSRELDRNWLGHRIRLMQDFTFRSLEAQTDQGFLHIVETRPETYTFVRNRIDPKHNLQLVTRDEMTDGSIPTTTNSTLEYVGSADKFYEVRLNSDDLFHRKYVQRLKEFDATKNTQAIVPQRGYFWYMAPDVIVKMKRRSPPFHALIYDTEEYRNGFRYELEGGHNGAVKIPHMLISGYNWLWLIHDWNNKTLRGKRFPDYRKFSRVDKSVIGEFGL